MATMVEVEAQSKKYCFPQDKPATKQELTQHIKNAMQSGRSYTHEEHTKDIDQWFNNL